MPIVVADVIAFFCLFVPATLGFMASLFALVCELTWWAEGSWTPVPAADPVLVTFILAAVHVWAPARWRLGAALCLPAGLLAARHWEVVAPALRHVMRHIMNHIMLVNLALLSIGCFMLFFGLSTAVKEPAKLSATLEHEQFAALKAEHVQLQQEVTVLRRRLAKVKRYLSLLPVKPVKQDDTV